MKSTAKTLRFFAAPLAEMLGVATLLYFFTLAMGGLTHLVIFSDYAISFCFLYGVFLHLTFWQFSSAYSQLSLSFGATRRSIRRAILVLWVVGSVFGEAFTVLAARLTLWMPTGGAAGRNVFLLQCGLRPVGGFCLMLFLAATGSAAGTALPASWSRAAGITAKIVLYIVAFAQMFVFMLLAYFWPQWFVPYCAALVVAAALLMAAAVRALRHAAVR